MSDTDVRLDEQLAQARHQLAAGAVPGWGEARRPRALPIAIVEAGHYLAAAANAGLAVAALDASGMPAPTRHTATMRGLNNQPLSRDDYASHLQAQVDLGRGEQRRPLLTSEEAQTVAALLDELAGVYPGEDLGARVGI